jgi:flagellar hook-associated protein 2
VAGGIGFDGLASGLDTGRILEQLLELERRPVRLLEAQLASVRATSGAIDGLAGKLAALRQAAVALRTPAAVLARTAATSDAGVLDAAAGTGAEPGTTAITVAQLARVSVARSAVGLPAADGAIGAPDGVFRFQVGAGAPVEVTVGAATTLEDLAAAVNALDAGVTARVVDVGPSGAASYRLHVASDATGAAQTIAVLQDDTGLGITTTQAGANAVVTRDDLGLTVERDGNVVADLLPGVTLTLRAPGTAVVTVTEDAAAVVARATALAAAYGELRAFVGGAAAITPADDAVRVGPLVADATARGAMQRLQQAITGEVAGFGYLARLGITTARDGSLAVDEAKLRTALATDPAGVAGTLAGAAGAVADLVDDLTASGGPLELRTAALDERARRLDASIVAAERRVDQVEAGLRRQFQALETLLASLAEQSRGLEALFPKDA